MTRNYRHNPYSRHAFRALTLAGAAILAAAAPASAQNTTPQPPPSALPPASELELALQTLLSQATPIAIDRLSLYLRGDDPAGARREAAAAIANAPSPPAELIAPLARALELAGDPETAAEVIRALGRFPTTDAILPVASYFFSTETLDPLAAKAARRAIASQTAQPRLAADEADLRQWWARFREMPERDRRAEIAIAQARKAERLSADMETANTRLLDVYRRLFAVTPDDSRSELLAELMRAEQTSVRILGIELATRTILNAKSVGPKVAEAAIMGLTHRDASVRAASAGLVDRLNLDEHAAPCAAAFATEQDPLAASAMMRYLSRHPQPGVAPPAILWFDERGPVGDAATELILALVREGILDEPQTETIRSELHERIPAHITAQSVALLDELGDRDRIIPLLDAPDARVAAAAAAALGQRRETLAIVLDAALDRSDLFEPACRALMLHRPDEHGFTEAEALQSSSAQRKRELLDEFAAVLSPAALLAVAERTQDLTRRESYLRRTASPKFIEAQDRSEDRIRLAEMLVRTRIELNDPAGALTVLEALPDLDESAPGFTDRACDTVHCLVWLNRLNDAQRITQAHDLPVRSWLAGLDSARTLPHAPAIIDRIRAIFEPRLTPDEAARLARYEAAILNPNAEIPGEPNTTDPITG